MFFQHILLYYVEFLKKTVFGRRHPLFEPLCSVFALPALCVQYVCVCVKTERLNDSAEHVDTGVGGGRKSMRGVSVNSCASVVYLCVHAGSEYPLALLNYTLVLQSDANLLWPSFLESATVMYDMAGQRKSQ